VGEFRAVVQSHRGAPISHFAVNLYASYDAKMLEHTVLFGLLHIWPFSCRAVPCPLVSTRAPELDHGALEQVS